MYAPVRSEYPKYTPNLTVHLLSIWAGLASVTLGRPRVRSGHLRLDRMFLLSILLSIFHSRTTEWMDLAEIMDFLESA